MGLKSTPEWEAAAIEIAVSHPRDYVKVAAWMKVLAVAGFEDDPIASIDIGYGVFAFETGSLCVLAIRARNSEPVLTHIFVRGGPHDIVGRRERAVAAARAIGLTSFIVL